MAADISRQLPLSHSLEEKNNLKNTLDSSGATQKDAIHSVTIAGNSVDAQLTADKKQSMRITADNVTSPGGAGFGDPARHKPRRVSRTHPEPIQEDSEMTQEDSTEAHTDDIGLSDSASNANKKSREATGTEQRVPTRESSFVKTVKTEAQKVEQTMAGSRPSLKKLKKGIFISYSPDAGFLERKFVVDMVRELKENNLAEDIWFDKDEKNTDSPSWFSLRMEAVERCQASIMVLSDSYFACPVSLYEGRTLLERHKTDLRSVSMYPVIFSLSEDAEVPKVFTSLLAQAAVDLTKEQVKSSLAEKISVTVGSLMPDLEKHATVLAGPRPYSPMETEFTGLYKNKKICQWTISDLQEWLFKLGIKEFFRQSLAESMVDGFLLMSLTDQDMISHLSIDSRVVRKKIMQQILVALDKEQKLPGSWHLRARTQRAKATCVYLVYDPADVRLAQNVKLDLVKKNLIVVHHQKLGQSKEEFLQSNGPHIATATYVLIVMTDAAINSPFVFHEVLFADWLGKKLVTVMFKNAWNSLRPALKAVLADCPAVDFERRLYSESLDVLEHHIKPLRRIPGVVLEQAYLNKMADGIKPFSLLATGTDRAEWMPAAEAERRIFISYQWDMQSKVEDIRRVMEANNFQCWADISPTMSLQRGQTTLSTVSSKSAHSVDNSSETLQSQIQRNMRAATVVVCCITPKYMQSDNCVKDLTLAETLHKPIVPVMLRFCPWPPEGAPSQVRKILAKHIAVDLSNEKLFKQNTIQLLDRVQRTAATPVPARR